MNKNLLTLALAAAFSTTAAFAQTAKPPAPVAAPVPSAAAVAAAPAVPADIRSVTQTAIETNPDVQVRWNTFKAARNEVDIAKGGWRPRVDLNAHAGPNRRDEPGFPNSRYTQAGGSLTLTQLLFDGFSTGNEVSRLNHAAMTRYYEFLDAAETSALEAVRAYTDVLRYREMVELARANYTRHEDIYKLIRERVQSGAGRRVDLDQAAGRLALAESNLITERSNLHDVTARYQRVINSLPPATLAQPAPLDAALPASAAAALDDAYRNHPAYFAAVENIRSAEATVRRAQGGYSPRVDLRASTDHARYNSLGQGPSSGASVEVVLTMNLYKGGSDAAAIRQQADLLSAAQDLRDKSCRDIRQTLLIAYNDVQQLSDQLTFLDRHRNSISVARDAYRQQFDIGQRTLLDLLDTENEYFQAQRAYVEGRSNRYLAQARVQAGEGRLLKVLGVARADQPNLDDLQQSDGRPAAAIAPCPVEVPPPYAPAPTALPAPAPAPALPAAMPVVVVPAPVAPRAATQAEAKKQIEFALDAWMKAWMAKDVQKYLDFYSPDFDPTKSNYSKSYDSRSMARASWLAYRKRLITKPGDIRVSASNVKVDMLSDTEGTLSFTQNYHSADYSDTVDKVLRVVQRDGKWLVKTESSVKK